MDQDEDYSLLGISSERRFEEIYFMIGKREQ